MSPGAGFGRDTLGFGPDTFAGRRVFVTGHTGFKGAWLALWLHRLGARVSGYALPPATEPNLFTLARVRETLAAHHEADVRDLPRLTAALRDAAPDLVFHLAAQALVRESYARPRDTFETNMLGVVNLLEAVRELRRPCIVIVITSDKCYENRPPHDPCRESDPLGGRDPYSASKAAAEHVVMAYRASFFPPQRLSEPGGPPGEHGVKLASVRAGNVIGGGDWAADRIVPDMVRSLDAGEPVPVRNPAAVRPWQHVLEPLGGYLALAARLLTSDEPRWCDAWNFGPRPEDAVPVRVLVERFLAAWGGGTWRDARTPGAPYESTVLQLAIDKVARELGWRPRWTLDETIRRTAAWYHACYVERQRDLRAACDADLDAYEHARAGADIG